jgi:hypothetical protein
VTRDLGLAGRPEISVHRRRFNQAEVEEMTARQLELEMADSDKIV